MDTTTRIKMKILEDLYSREQAELKAKYSKYYESLDKSQPKIVVTDVLNKLLKESGDKLKCYFNEDGFVLSEIN